MKESVYKNYEELPLFLNAKIVADLLGVSPSTAYAGTQRAVPDLGGRAVETMSRKRDGARNFFPMPYKIFNLDLCAGEIAVYAYLMCRENRKTYQCYPSYRTIGEAVGMSRNTVKKYVDALVDKQLIFTEPTQVTTQDGTVRNGNLRYTIRPLECALEHHLLQQLS